MLGTVLADEPVDEVRPSTTETPRHPGGRLSVALNDGVTAAVTDLAECTKTVDAKQQAALSQHHDNHDLSPPPHALPFCGSLDVRDGVRLRSVAFPEHADERPDRTGDDHAGGGRGPLDLARRLQ